MSCEPNVSGKGLVASEGSDDQSWKEGADSADTAPARVAASRQRRDPAEQMRTLHVFYNGWHPTRLGKFVNRCTAWLSAHALTPQILVTLQTRGRNSGRLRSNVLVPVTYNGKRYLVSMLGDGSEWVRNVRAQRGQAFIRRNKTHPVMLTEISPQDRAPILKLYCEVATSGRHHFPLPYTAPVSEFESIAAEYPVFRIDAPTRK